MRWAVAIGLGIALRGAEARELPAAAVARAAARVEERMVRWPPPAAVEELVVVVETADGAVGRWRVVWDGALARARLDLPEALAGDEVGGPALVVAVGQVVAGLAQALGWLGAPLLDEASAARRTSAGLTFMGGGPTQPWSVTVASGRPREVRARVGPSEVVVALGAWTPVDGRRAVPQWLRVDAPSGRCDVALSWSEGSGRWLPEVVRLQRGGEALRLRLSPAPGVTPTGAERGARGAPPPGRPAPP